VNAFERRVRAAVYAPFRDEGAAPSVARLGGDLVASREDVVAALHALADLHCLVLVPGTESVWMAHPFWGIETDFRVTVGTRQWFANCVWDGLALLALFGDGSLATHSPATGQPLRFEACGGRVRGAGVVHFLVPARTLAANQGLYNGFLAAGLLWGSRWGRAASGSGSSSSPAWWWRASSVR
jgi:Alkylmercury lyase/Protein of unknown function (DUF1304)